jgi:hypothetical protein
MPTLNPRINVTVSPSLDMLVARLAVHQRVSKSQVLRELLQTAEPTLQRVVALLDAASTSSREVLTGLAVPLSNLKESAGDDLAVHLSRLERMRDLVSEAEAISERRPARRREGTPLAGSRSATVGVPNPSASNRGVKSTKQGAPRATRRVRK